MSGLFAEHAFSNNPSIDFKAASVPLETAPWFTREDVAAPPHQRAKAVDMRSTGSHPPTTLCGKGKPPSPDRDEGAHTLIATKL